MLPAGAPQPGWTGKAWACHVGAQETCGELLLFLDADTVLAHDAVTGLLDGGPLTTAFDGLAGRPSTYEIVSGSIEWRLAEPDVVEASAVRRRVHAE